MKARIHTTMTAMAVTTTPPTAPPVEGERRHWHDRAMRGLMQDWPLLCHKVIDYAAKHHGRNAVACEPVPFSRVG